MQGEGKILFVLRQGRQGRTNNYLNKHQSATLRSSLQALQSHHSCERPDLVLVGIFFSPPGKFPPPSSTLTYIYSLNVGLGHSPEDSGLGTTMDSLPEPSETVEDEWASMKIRFRKEGLDWSKLSDQDRILQVINIFRPDFLY